jgi:hypothetical protein
MTVTIWSLMTLEMMIFFQDTIIQMPIFFVYRDKQRKGEGHVSVEATLASEDDQSTARLDEVSPTRAQAWASEGEEFEATRWVTCFYKHVYD